MKASIEVIDLTKRYGEVEAVRGISFTIKPGEIVGFLGPNGAGKSTTMKILTCFMGANSGVARVAGFDVREEPDEVRRRIGYLPESVPLYEEMLVWDYLDFVAELRGVKKADREGAIRRTVGMTGLEEMLGRAVGELSKGYRQRVGLAQAIIHEPDVVILDEPTSGLDPNQIIEIRDVIRAIGQEKTVLFSTHIMQEVTAVCDRIIIINRGKLTADDTLEGLTQQMIARFDGLEVIARHASKEPVARALPGARIDEIARDADSLTLRISGTESNDAMRAKLFKAAAKESLDLIKVAPYTPTLEQIFRAYTGDDVEELTRSESEEE